MFFMSVFVVLLALNAALLLGAHGLEKRDRKRPVPIA